jgi:hypothetical protein
MILDIAIHYYMWMYALSNIITFQDSGRTIIFNLLYTVVVLWYLVASRTRILSEQHQQLYSYPFSYRANSRARRIVVFKCLKWCPNMSTISLPVERETRALPLNTYYEVYKRKKECCCKLVCIVHPIIYLLDCQVMHSLLPFFNFRTRK